jgi:2-haloacid dehalogenase
VTENLDAVVFDLGGVLIDWNPRHLYRSLFADHADMEAFLTNICTGDWHREHDLGGDIRASCQRLARLYPGYHDLIMAWADRGEEMAAGQFDDTVAVLAELKAADIRCYALSNMEAEVFPVRRARFAFMDWFDGCVISGVEGLAKPDRRIFEILLNRYGLEPAATIFIDDSAQNVAAANALGIHALHYASAQQLRQELRTLGVPPLPAG